MDFQQIRKYVKGVLTNSFLNKTTLDKLSTSNEGNLLFDGKEISGGLHEYSTEEQIIGKWIDGKPIYEKVINMGYLPNSSSINIDVSELNIDNIIELRGMCYTDDKKNIRPITLGTSDTNAIRIDVTNNTIRIFTWSDWSAYNSFCIIQYTKTTD